MRYALEWNHAVSFRADDPVWITATLSAIYDVRDEAPLVQQRALAYRTLTVSLFLQLF